MANPIILEHNRFEEATPTVTSAAAGFPITNITDWRPNTAYRWKATGTGDQHIDLDLGTAVTCDAWAIAGHNLISGAATVTLYNGAASPAADIKDSMTFSGLTTDVPVMQTFTAGQPRRYWRVSITGTPSVAAQIGILVLGLQIDFTAGALPDLDPYHRSAVAEPFVNNNGSPVGVNVRHKSKVFNMTYGANDPGMTRDDFFAPGSGREFDVHFLPHAVDNAKPFFFAWNLDIDPRGEVYLCRVDGPEVSMPFVGATTRRGLQCRFIATKDI